MLGPSPTILFHSSQPGTCTLKFKLRQKHLQNHHLHLISSISKDSHPCLGCSSCLELAQQQRGLVQTGAQHSPLAAIWVPMSAQSSSDKLRSCWASSRLGVLAGCRSASRPSLELDSACKVLHGTPPHRGSERSLPAVQATAYPPMHIRPQLPKSHSEHTQVYPPRAAFSISFRSSFSPGDDLGEYFPLLDVSFPLSGPNTT